LTDRGGGGEVNEVAGTPTDYLSTRVSKKLIRNYQSAWRRTPIAVLSNSLPRERLGSRAATVPSVMDNVIMIWLNWGQALQKDSRDAPYAGLTEYTDATAGGMVYPLENQGILLLHF